MWTYKPLVVSLSLLLGVAGVGMAVETPLAVSPGDASTLAVVEARCPTFNWGAAEGAESYELVVYRLGEEGEEAQPVLRQNFAGSVYGWTPSLDRCLERGGRYAWSVRAAGREKASKWSRPNLFQVAAGPSEVEFEEALAVVQQYLEEHGTPPDREAESAEPVVPVVPSVTNSATGGAEAETKALAAALSDRSTPAVSAPTGLPAFPLNIQAAQAVTYLESTGPLSGSVLELRSSAAAPSFLGAINFNNAVNTFPGQIIYHGDNEMTFHTNDAEQMRITNTGDVTNPLAQNGLVKAWAKIFSDGTIEDCYRCNTDVAETRRISEGLYEVDFTPISQDINSRPFLCSNRNIAVTIQCFVSSGDDDSSIVVHTKSDNGTSTDGGFIVVVF